MGRLRWRLETTDNRPVQSYPQINCPKSLALCSCGSRSISCSGAFNCGTSDWYGKRGKSNCGPSSISIQHCLDRRSVRFLQQCLRLWDAQCSQMSPRSLDVYSSMKFPSGESKIHRRYVTPGAELNTGVSAPHQVYIRDARPLQDGIQLDVNGFQLFQHKSKARSPRGPY
jgi:hypothetical protein